MATESKTQRPPAGDVGVGGLSHVEDDRKAATSAFDAALRGPTLMADRVNDVDALRHLLMIDRYLWWTEFVQHG